MCLDNPINKRMTTDYSKIINNSDIIIHMQ